MTEVLMLQVFEDSTMVFSHFIPYDPESALREIPCGDLSVDMLKALMQQENELSAKARLSPADPVANKTKSHSTERATVYSFALKMIKHHGGNNAQFVVVNKSDYPFPY